MQIFNLSEYVTLRKLIDNKVVLKGVTGKIFSIAPFKNVVIKDNFVPYDYCLCIYPNGAMFIGKETRKRKQELMLEREFQKVHSRCDLRITKHDNFMRKLRNGTV